MAKNTETARLAGLSEALLEALESQRRLGGAAYPATLEQLAAVCEGSPSVELLIKAVAKKPFSDRATIEKENRKPKVDGFVCFKADMPSKEELKKRKLAEKEELKKRELAEKEELKKRELAEKEEHKKRELANLAERMRKVLESQRRLGGNAYPPPLRRLVELCELKASDSRVPGIVAHESLGGQLVVGGMSGKKPQLDAPVFLAEDASDALPALITFALDALRTGPARTFTKKVIAGKLAPALRSRVEAALSKGKVEEQALPEELAWVPAAKGEPLFFHVDDLQPSSPRRSDRPSPVAPATSQAARSPSTNGTSQPTQRDFALAFRQAFDEIDQRNRATNFVKLSELRRALAEFGRGEFDAGLRQLRLDGLYSLNSHEGLHGSLTSEDREAGVQEVGSFYIYASRR